MRAAVTCTLLAGARALRPPTARAAVRRFSVGGPIYDAADGGDPVVSLYTKGGCTLCDAAVEILREVRGAAPHALVAVDITDPANEAWWDRRPRRAASTRRS